MYEGDYVRLYIDGELMMSDTAMERITNREIIQKARGRVLIAGLGLCLIVQSMLENEEITEIVVIEKYQDVVDLVQPIFKHSKLKVITADIFEHEMSKEEKFDCIYFDIWATISTDNLDEMKILHRKYRKNLNEGGYMDSWMRDILKRKRIKERREEKSHYLANYF